MLKSDHRSNIRAVELAEWIVDEISAADRDWNAIGLRARELLELAIRQDEARRSASAQSPRSRPLRGPAIVRRRRWTRRSSRTSSSSA
jgi:hypothetical protein